MDKWLLDLVDKLNGARTPAEVMQVIDRLEDAYDAFSGPGEELVSQLLDRARDELRRLEG
ncbi:MAG TPA: hypothetical protein PLW81_15815 [Thiobacillaceae bacterium]|nr:hypothetical protein [Thiobacillaceae bacterium]